jgi:hypothetical protein
LSPSIKHEPANREHTRAAMGYSGQDGEGDGVRGSLYGAGLAASWLSSVLLGIL